MISPAHRRNAGEDPEIPGEYHAAITSPRRELVTLGACAREWVNHFSPRAVILMILLVSAVRVSIGGFNYRDLIVLLTILAIQPFAEWLIHRALLHSKPVRIGNKQVEFYAATQHRAHHEAPARLDRVLLKRYEVLASLVAVVVIAPLMAIIFVVIAGGDWTRLSVTAVLVFCLGMLRYEWSHFLIHTPYVPKSRYFQSIWRSHRLHHFKHEDYWMGVSSNFADRVLRTFPDQEAIQRSATARTLGVSTCKYDEPRHR